MARIGLESPEIGGSTGQGLSVVVPTLDEQENVGQLLKELDAHLYRYSTEVVFVDDSDTAETQEAIRAAVEMIKGSMDVRVLPRDNRTRWGGLGGAVVDGIGAAAHRLVVVMDADLQHPPAIVGELVETLKDLKCDLCVASRYLDMARTDTFSGVTRSYISTVSTIVVKRVLGARVNRVSDPLSGFFVFDRSKVDSIRLRPNGFKILLEMLATHPELHVAEISFGFAERFSGSSKASPAEAIRFCRNVFRLHRQR